MKPAIGQYIPGNSFLHRTDPRIKILLTIIYMVAIMFIDSFIGYAASGAVLVAAVIASRLSPVYVLKSVKPLIFLILLTIVLNIFFYGGETLWAQFWIIKIYKEAILFSVKMALRILILVAGASLLTFTTSSIALTDGLERLMSPLEFIHFPAHDIAMMMSIALRFIPIFSDEATRIMDAQKSRGAEFDTGGLIKKVKGLVPIIIPLIVSAFRRAEDLASAMEARCYRGGKGRTRFKVLKFTWRDPLAFAIITALLVCIIVFSL